jgi:type I restriction enzyme S subunit
MSSLVPEGWSRKKLGDSLIPRPKSKLPSGESNPLGYYDFYVCSHKVLKSFHNEYSSPSILFSTGGEASVHLATERYAFSTDVWATEFEGDICNDYVFRLLEENIRTINYSGFQGSGIKHLDKSFIEKLEFSIPPLPEQKKIASILTSVDEVIESTQKQIDKLQDLKKATMNELLTKGIGHTEFKDSELGRIPKSWSISNIEKLTQFVTSGSRGWSQYYSSEGSLFIRIGNLTRDHINLKFADIQLVEPPSGGEGTRTKVKVGDILVSITADLGVIGIVNESLGEAYVNQHVCLVRLESVSDVNPRWVGHFLSGHAGQEQFAKKNDGGAKAGLNLPTIRSIIVPIPSPEEQNKVVRVLDRLDSKISIKQTKLSKHQSLKKSLMQDLLTGKVRVMVN